MRSGRAWGRERKRGARGRRKKEEGGREEGATEGKGRSKEEGEGSCNLCVWLARARRLPCAAMSCLCGAKPVPVH